jgi:hypothetical protein
MAFKYASAYSNGFDQMDPITPGADLSTDATESFGGTAFRNLGLGSDLAGTGLDAFGKQQIAKERAKAYKDQAAALNAQATASNNRGTVSGIGKVLGGVVGLFNPAIGGAISMGSGFLG